ncbi:unnamed protein product [Hydatigera taeniaeformis]|uniref:KR domain-containing protein n=1 Tax=Hydatigena taeniaeformis TaxID=6205 RepID=A0A0R3WY56_HYDTA|nr:unnamed protein product [Hydatigera taeniaeformis]
MCLLWWWIWCRPQEVSIVGCHVLITGGSSGIGLALAGEALRRGPARLTLVARDVNRLEKARATLIEAYGTACDLRTISLDITAPYEEIKQSLLVTHNGALN